MTYPDGPSPRHRRPRVPIPGDGGAPAMTVATLAAAGIAVIVGFVLLRSITSEPARAGDAVSAVATTTVTSVPVSPTSAAPTTTTTTTTPVTTTTVAPGASKSDAVVMVANASGVHHSAAAMAAAMAADGYTMAPAANSTGPRLRRSVIYYLDGNPASLGVARLLAAQIPSAEVLPMPQPPPLDRPLNRATVVLLLGRDAAGRPLTKVTSG